MDTYQLVLEAVDVEDLEVGRVFGDAGPVDVKVLDGLSVNGHSKISVTGPLPAILAWVINPYCGGDAESALDLVRPSNPDLVKITPVVGGVEQVPEWIIKVKYVDASGNKQVHKASFLAWSWHDAKQQAAEIVDAVQADYGSVKGATLKITD